MGKKKIVVCSKNQAKNQAVADIFVNYFDDIEICSVETNSGVSETPMSDNEGLLGCKQRIDDAMKKEDGDIFVAMEGIISKNKFGAYLCGWAMIYIKETDEYLSGCSAKIKIPKEIMCEIKKDVRLSKIVARHFDSTDEKVGEIGTNGILTQGVYTRTDEFKDAINCAISTKYKIKERRRI